MPLAIGGANQMTPDSPPPDATPPPIEVELLKREPRHVCTAVRRVPGGVEIEAACRPAAWRALAAINAIGNGRVVPLFHRPEPGNAADDLILYHAYAPAALLREDLRFEAVSKQGQAAPVFTAGTRRIKLPGKWGFSRYQLDLEYLPSGRDAPGEEDMRCFVRSIAVEGDALRLDMSVFLAGRAEEGEALDIEVSRGANDPQPFRATTPLIAAKRVFRVPVAMHRKYTGLDVAHAVVDLPIAAIFDDADLYEVSALARGRRLDLFPYNEYYHDKPAEFSIDTGVATHHVRHFADPVTGNVRLAYR